MVLAVGLIGLAALFLEPVHGKSQQSPGLHICHTLAVTLFYYANEHDGKYPEGKSSTEVFQKLVDEKYITEPDIFYFPFEGKTKWTSGKLKPENVCWDVTSGLNAGDSDETPLVFITGYRLDYRPGAAPMC